MKRATLHGILFVIVGCASLVVGAVGGFLLGRGDSILVIRNLSDQEIVRAYVYFDGAQAVELGAIDSHTSRQTRIGGGERAVRVDLTLSSGKSMSTAEIYLAPGGHVFVAVSETTVSIDHSM
jgi:hypothetical protein